MLGLLVGCTAVNVVTLVLRLSFIEPVANVFRFLDPEGGSQNATVVVVLVVRISPLASKNP